MVFLCFSRVKILHTAPLNLLSISPLQKKKEKKGGLVLPAKRQLYRINMNTIPGGERKEERKKEI